MKKQLTLLGLLLGIALMAAPAAARKAAPSQKNLPAALAKVDPSKIVLFDYTGIRGKKCKDPTAFKGQASVFTAGKYRYKGRIHAGIYDIALKKGLFNNPLPVTAQDRKYHWYKMGTVKLGSNSLLHIADWKVSVPLKKYANTTCEFWIHVKAEGPDYIKGSKGDSRLLMDRVVLVKQN